MNEDYANAFFLGVEREASSLAKTKRDVEALVEAKEKERKKEEEKRQRNERETEEGIERSHDVWKKKKKKKKKKSRSFLSSRVVRFARCSHYIAN